MAWLCVNKDGTELINPTEPIRDEGEEIWDCTSENAAGWFDDYSITLPKGSIKKLIDRELTWRDEPVKLI